MAKILIFGKGYIGTEYLNSNLFEEVFLSGKDITGINEIETEVKWFKPDVILNCAGKTHLEWCRDNRLGAIMANIAGPLNLLKASKDKGIYLVHLGSGCIFEGDNNGRGYSEEDKPNPQCFYAYTKALADELLIKEGYDKLLILRIRQPFSDSSHPRNLITKVLNYKKLITSQNSMTYLPDLISATNFLLSKKAFGIFNVVNNGTASPYEIAMMTKEFMRMSKKYVPISKRELDKMDKKNKREKRVDAVLNIAKLKKTGFKIPDVRGRLKESLNAYRKF